MCYMHILRMGILSPSWALMLPGVIFPVERAEEAHALVELCLYPSRPPGGCSRIFRNLKYSTQPLNFHVVACPLDMIGIC